MRLVKRGERRFLLFGDNQNEEKKRGQTHQEMQRHQESSPPLSFPVFSVPLLQKKQNQQQFLEKSNTRAHC